MRWEDRPGGPGPAESGLETAIEAVAAGDLDRALLGRLAAGDRSALPGLMERHYRRLYRVLLGYLRQPDDALDAVQETFVKVVEHAARWNPQAEPASWLTRIAVNHAIDRLRRRKRWAPREQPLFEGDHASSLGSDAPSPDRRVYAREVSERLGRALQGLPERQRTVFVLRHYDELSLEEIASALQMSLGTVKSSLHRALVQLRRRLGSLRP